MNESKKLSAEKLWVIRESAASHDASTLPEVDRISLLDHIDAMEAEYKAGMQRAIDDAFRQAEVNQKFQDEQTARIKELLVALTEARERLELEGVEYESIDVVLKANGPG